MKYAKITEHNKMNPAFRKGLNRFSDMVNFKNKQNDNFICRDINT